MILVRHGYGFWGIALYTRRVFAGVVVVWRFAVGMEPKFLPLRINPFVETKA